MLDPEPGPCHIEIDEVVPLKMTRVSHLATRGKLASGDKVQEVATGGVAWLVNSNVDGGSCLSKPDTRDKIDSVRD